MHYWWLFWLVVVKHQTVGQFRSAVTSFFGLAHRAKCTHWRGEGIVALGTWRTLRGQQRGEEAMKWALHRYEGSFHMSWFAEAYVKSVWPILVVPHVSTFEFLSISLSIYVSGRTSSFWNVRVQNDSSVVSISQKQNKTRSPELSNKLRVPSGLDFGTDTSCNHSLVTMGTTSRNHWAEIFGA